jgi:hypothetical protein
MEYIAGKNKYNTKNIWRFSADGSLICLEEWSGAGCCPVHFNRESAEKLYEQLGTALAAVTKNGNA